MAVFRPFRGCRYNPSAAGNPSSLLCPPYDMIGPELKQALQRLSPYNAVHLEGGEQPDPVNPEAGYSRAATLFQDWLTGGVLRQEGEPCFYLMRHSYRHRGQARAQLGLFGDILVEDYGGGSVLPHEFTREPAVLDRVALLEASKTQFSPLMTLYRDAEGELAPVFDAVMAGAPELAAAAPPEGNIGDVTLWRITDSGLQQRITGFFAGRPVFLADGHHRYEAALRYRQSQSQSRAQAQAQAQGQAQVSGGGTPDAAHNYVMMSLTEFDDPGLLLLPYHKVIGGLSTEQLERLRQRLRELFDAEPVNLADFGGAEGFAELVAARSRERNTLTIGLLGGLIGGLNGGLPGGLDGPGAAAPSILTLREEIDRQDWGALAVSEAWALDEQVIRPLLGDAMSRHLDYSHDAEGAAEMVAAGAQQLAFLLKPFPMDAFEAIVGDGQRLPSKSTFFYPKLPTGLVINRLDGRL